MTGQLDDEATDPELAAVLEDLVAKLDVVAAGWLELTDFCDTLPRTLVHADLSRKNLRIARDADGLRLLAFDWSEAGWGIQAADFAQLPRNSGRLHGFSADACLETYRACLAESGYDLSAEAVELMAVAGNLFRCLAGIDWLCTGMTATWGPAEKLRHYSLWLGDAIQAAGWSAPGRAAMLA
jgi:Ser/Thr protein kinase RdoA (MazF antagonist)